MTAPRAKRSGGLRVREWNGKALAGTWEVSRKIDGVCVIVSHPGGAVSRAGKPLYNVPDLAPGVYECFLGSWERTVGRLRSPDGDAISRDSFYALCPVDRRLLMRDVIAPMPHVIGHMLMDVTQHGDEGLIMRQGGTYLKVKPVNTYDVRVTGILMGRGKHAGRLGALDTERGRVGTGFSDAQRAELCAAPFVKAAQYGGVVVEVAALGLTPGGKFRHPRFVRVRWDK